MFTRLRFIILGVTLSLLIPPLISQPGKASITTALGIEDTARSKCFDASNGCTPGPNKIGQVDYDFEDEFNLPLGSSTPAYSNIDVRATVRYPAKATGIAKPVAGTGRYPLIIFLHGNHATCPCSCSHTCAKADRIPNHLGYNYLLDILASWGFIAVSIDGFDVTCVGSAVGMTDYEARGRLVLRHLDKWKTWNATSSDPWGGLFKKRVNMNSIGLSGHSRGGEGVVAAEFINRNESLGFHIKAVNAIAPTDQDFFIHYVPEVPYFLLLAASDGDVSNLQGLRTYDRTSLVSAAKQSDKTMLWVYGANHNFFNTVWTPTATCASDDGIGEGRLSSSLQRLTACQSIIPFFRLYLQNEIGYRKLFLGEVAADGLEGIRMFWTFQNRLRREVDNFDIGNDPNTNSLGGPVTTSGGFSAFNEINIGAAPLTFHFTRGLRLGWSATQTYTTELPVGQRNLSSFNAMVMRVSQVIDPLNPLDTPRTLRVSLQTTSGILSNVGFDVATLRSVPYPYEYNGGKTVLGMVRIPLTSFRNGNHALPLTNIKSVILQFQGTGLVAVDDIQFSK